MVTGLERTLAANPQITILSELSRGELERRGLDPEAILSQYVDLGFTLSLFDDYGRLNEIPVDALVKLHRARRLAPDVSVFLALLTDPWVGLAS